VCFDQPLLFFLLLFASQLDARDNYTPGWKFNNWELKGVPIRIEVRINSTVKAKSTTHIERTDTQEEVMIKYLVRVWDLVSTHGVMQWRKPMHLPPQCRQ